MDICFSEEFGKKNNILGFRLGKERLLCFLDFEK